MLLSDYSIKFRTAVFVFIFTLVIFGIVSYNSLPREGSPDITIPYVFVNAIYEGTSPEEMEKLITVPLEKQLNDVENIKEMRSTTADSVATISIEFLAGEDIDLAKQRVKDKVDLAGPDLPADLDEPVVDAFNFSSDQPIFTLALSGDTPLDRLTGIAEDLQEAIELLPGIREAEISGIREREIRIEPDLEKLALYSIPVTLFIQRLSEENKTISAGNIEMVGNKFQVRIPGEYEYIYPLKNLLLANRNGHPIYLSDVATISDTYKDRETVTRLNSESAVSLGVKKRSGENSVAVIERVKELLDSFSIPPDIHLTHVYDESDYIDSMIKELENNILTGFVLVVVVLLFFLGVRNATFVGLAIPFSMLIAFTIMNLQGGTLNMIVLFSLVLAVGMLVDNAIVIVENIYRNRTEGLTRIEAARRGASEVAWPVITSTITTLAAFSPLLFWPDIMGQFMGFLPRTLIVVLTASLFVAIVINPAVCSVFIEGRKRESKDQKEHPFMQNYERFLRGALHHRGIILVLGLLLLVFTFLIYGRFGEGVELFPETDPRSATVNIRFPQGTSLEFTDQAMQDIEKKLQTYPDIKFYLTTAGSGAGFGASRGTHLGNIHIEFVDIDERMTNSMQLVSTIREHIGTIPGSDLKVEKQEEGPPLGAPISIELSGDEFELLSEYSSSIMRNIETIPGLVDLQDDFEEALPELQFHVNRNQAAMLGLNTDSIGTFLRMAFYGLEISDYRMDEDEYDITLRLPEPQRRDVQVLDQIMIPTPTGSTIPLTSAGKAVYTGGRGAITRKDQKRLVTITGNNEKRGVDEIIQDIQKRLTSLNLPRGYTINYSGDTEEMQESGAFLSRAFTIALGLIVVVLVIQFNSVLLPFIILMSVVLSLIGVMWGLLICRMRFGIIMTGVGVISLAGIVVNNSIVLIDCIIQRRREGLSATESVVVAGKTRLRPVLLTATTTILGLIPMAVGYSVDIHTWPPKFVAGAESSQWWAPMAVAVIFGLLVSTLLTLIVAPLMYSLADSLTQVLTRRFGENTTD